MTNPAWPGHLPITRLRIARPTDRLTEVTAFYRDVIGLSVIGGWVDDGTHAGYNGVMIGLPGWDTHLEFTSHKDGSPCPAPTRDNLLVLYVDSRDDLLSVSASIQARGGVPVEPENPYWRDRAVCFEDPDGWGVVFSLKPGVI